MSEYLSVGFRMKGGVFLGGGGFVLSVELIDDGGSIYTRIHKR